MATREDVIIRFGGDARGVNQTLGTIRTSVTGMVSSLSGLAAGIGAGFGLSALFRATIENTRAQNQALAQLDATIKSTGGIAGLTREELVGLASEMQRLTNYGDEAVVSMESILGTFTQIKDKGIFRDATAAILDLSTKLGQDLKTSAVQVGKALNDPIAGITALKRVGVSFTDSQQKVIKNLAETNQLASAQKLIIAELNKEFGGSAKAAANPMIQLKNAFGDLFESSASANEQIKALTASLQDPATVAGFQSITAAVFAATGALASFASGTANAAREVGEWFAKIQGYANDEGDLSKAIADTTKEIEDLKTTMPSGGLFAIFGGPASMAAWMVQLNAAEKRLKTLLDLQKAVGKEAAKAPETKAPVATGKSGESLPSEATMAGNASKSFTDYTKGLVEARNDAAIKTKSIVSQQYAYESRIGREYLTEQQAIRKNDVMAAEQAQAAQEAAFRKLAEISKPGPNLSYYEKMVGEMTNNPIAAKMKISVDRTEVDGIPTFFQADMLVTPQLLMGPGGTQPLGLTPEQAADTIDREVDQTGANP